MKKDMKYVLAKSCVGKEYLYSKQMIISVPTSSADIICDALNKSRYQLKEGQVWHKHEEDCVNRDYIFHRATLRKGKITINYI